MGLDKFQRIVADSYKEGEFSSVGIIQEAKDLGDGLFTFLMIELSEDEDCDSIEEAISRINKIISQVRQVCQALHAEEDKKYEQDS